jgi:hypothetical protein
MSERSPYDIERNHQRAWCQGGGLEPKVLVERCGAVIERIDGHCAYGELVGGVKDPLECVE